MASNVTKKVSSSSLTPTAIGSYGSSRYDLVGAKFHINIIEPIEIPKEKPVNSVDVKDRNKINDVKAIKYSTMKKGAIISASKPKVPRLNNNKVTRLMSIINIQKNVRRFLVRRETMWKLTYQRSMDLIYKSICFRDEHYHTIEGYLDQNQDIIIHIFNINKRVMTQELHINKKEYILMTNDFSGMNFDNTYIDSSRSASTFKNFNVEQVDFNYLIDEYLQYDDVIQAFIFNTRDQQISESYGKEIARTGTFS